MDEILKPRMIDKLKARFSAPPRVYSDKQLRELGIDPKLFVFMSRPDFSDNSYALWEYITKNTGYRTAWLLLHPEHSAKLREKGVENAAWNTPEGQALARSARFFVYTITADYVHKHPGQIFINVWHGAGVKGTEFVSFNEDHPYLLNTKRHANDTDLFLAHSVIDRINMAATLSTDARTFVATGQPRMDRVRTADGKNNIKKIFDGALAKYEKFIFYAPTVRNNSICKDGDFFGSNIFNLKGYSKQKLDTMLERFAAALVVKLHPVDSNKFKREDLQLGDDCYLLSDSDLFFADLQTNDILNAFDIMVGDYSSLITDYLLLDRPLVYALGDYDEYSQTKGFVFNDVSFYMPGPKVDNFDSLLTALEDGFINPQRHSQWRNAVVKQRFSFTDNMACQRALAAIENYQPLTDYGEQLFAANTLMPVAQQYENALSEQEQRLWHSESRICAAIKILKEASNGNQAIDAALAALNASPVSHAEQKALAAKAALQTICDEWLSGYSGEYVFFTIRQMQVRQGKTRTMLQWREKTRTMLQQVAAQVAGMGHLCFLGETANELMTYPDTVSQHPSARELSQRLVALDYSFYPETVLECIKRHRKKAVLLVSSDFYDDSNELLEMGVSGADKVVYFYRYPVKHYLGNKDYSPVDVAQWEALQYAGHSDKVCFIACSEETYNLSKEVNSSREVFLQTPGVDYSMFANQRTLRIPEKLRAVKAMGKPVIGYCGAIDNRLYFSIIHYICGTRPDYQFVFVGPSHRANTWIHVFHDYQNIHLLDEADYACMPDIISALDVAIIPYFRTAAERVPAKLFEYFACGKPVVTTSMAIGYKYDNIFMGESHGDFLKCLDAALDAKDDVSLRRKAAVIAEENDWGNKAREMLGWIGL